MVNQQELGKTIHSKVFKWEKKWVSSGKIRVYKWMKSMSIEVRKMDTAGTKTYIYQADQLVDDFIEDTVMDVGDLEAPGTPGIQPVADSAKQVDFNELDENVEDYEMEQAAKDIEDRERREDEEDNIIDKAVNGSVIL